MSDTKRDIIAKVENYRNLDPFQFGIKLGVKDDKVFSLLAHMSDDEIKNFDPYKFGEMLGVSNDKIFETIVKSNIEKNTIGEDKKTDKNKAKNGLFKRGLASVMIALLLATGACGAKQAVEIVGSSITQASEDDKVVKDGIKQTIYMLQNMGIVETSNGEDYNLTSDYDKNLKNLIQLDNVSGVEQVLLESAINNCTKDMNYDERETLLNTVYFYTHEDCRRVAAEDGYQSGRELAITLRSPNGNPPPSDREIASAIESGKTFVTKQVAFSNDSNLSNNSRGGRI